MQDAYQTIGKSSQGLMMGLAAGAQNVASMSGALGAGEGGECPLVAGVGKSAVARDPSENNLNLQIAALEQELAASFETVESRPDPDELWQGFGPPRRGWSVVVGSAQSIPTKTIGISSVARVDTEPKERLHHTWRSTSLLAIRGRCRQRARSYGSESFSD